MALTKPIDEITVDDLNTLVTDKELEKQTVDYKATLKLDITQIKEEFRKDISSFANASGGDYIIGIREDGGFPVEVCGMSESNPDGFKLQIENVLQSHIQPRIPGIQVHPVHLKDNLYVVIVRVPRSFARPHQVSINQNYQFYSRNSGGNYRMDVDQLRAAFLLSETLQERIRGFRQDRLGQIIAGETPLPMSTGPKWVLHLIPLNAFDISSSYDLKGLEIGHGYDSMLMPLSNLSTDRRFNFDGLLTYSRDEAGADGYAQLFRNGIIETVGDRGLTFENKFSETTTSKFVRMTYYEKALIEIFPKLITLQRVLGVDAPILLMASLLGVKGYLNDFQSRFHQYQQYQSGPIDKNDLIVPEVIVEGNDFTHESAATLLRPVFDTLWNACGWEACPNYDVQGVWKNRPYA